MKQIKLIIALGFSLSLFGQEFTSYNEGDGLINNSVNCLALDMNDQLWIGTNSGLSFFDGNSWLNYNENSGLVNNLITAVFIDNQGLVWVGTDYGLQSYDGNDWQLFTEENGLGDDRINHINQHEDGSIWIGENNGLSVFDGNSWTSYGMSDGLPFGGVNYISFDSEGRAWLANSIFGALSFDGTQFISYDVNFGIINNNVRTVEVDEQDNKWITTGAGITVLDSDNQVSEHHTIILQLPPPDTLNPTVDLAFDSNGNPWVGIYVDYLVTVGGIAYGANNQWYGYTDAEGLVGPVVRDVVIDSQDIVWVATSSGISKIDPQNVSIYETKEKPLFTIYPNPSSEEFYINTSVNSGIITVYNSLGTIVSVVKLEELLNNTINLSQMAKGVYIVDLERDGARCRQLLILE